MKLFIKGLFAMRNLKLSAYVFFVFFGATSTTDLYAQKSSNWELESERYRFVSPPAFVISGNQVRVTRSSAQAGETAWSELDIKDSMNKWFEQVSTLSETARTEAGIYRNIAPTIIGAAQGGATGGLLGSVIGAAGSFLTAQSNALADKVETNTNAISQWLVREAVNSRLDSEEVWSQIEDLGQLSPEEAKRHAMGLAEAIRKDVYNDNPLNRAEQEAVNQALIRTLMGNVGVLRSKTSTNEEAIEANKNSTEQNAADLLALTKFTTEFAVQMDQRVDNLEQAMSYYIDFTEDMYEQVDDHEERIYDIENQVGVLQSFAWSRMNEGEKITAIQSGFFPDWDDTRKSDEIKTLRKQQDIKEVFETATQVLDYASVMAGVAQHFNLPPHIAKDIQTAAVKGSAVTKIIFEFINFPPNVLSVLKGLASLFGGGPSAEERRHEQVMKGLNKLMKGQEHIQKQLESISEKLSKVLNAQLEMMRTLNRIEVTMNTRFDRIESLLAALSSDVQNISQNLYVTDHPLLPCYDFFAARSDLTEETLASFPPVSPNFFDENGDFLTACNRGIQAVLNHFNEDPADLLNLFNKLFSARSFSSNIENSAAEESYAQNLKLLASDDQNTNPDAYQKPQGTLRRLFAYEKPEEQAPQSALDRHLIESYLPLRIYPQAAIDLAEFILLSIPYTEAYELHLGDVQELGNVKSRIERLKNVLSILNLAITQVEIFSGEPILESAYDNLKANQILDAAKCNEGPAHSQSKALATFCAVRSNPYFEHNFMIYSISRHLRETRKSNIFYRILSNSELESAISSGLDLFPGIKFRKESNIGNFKNLVSAVTKLADFNAKNYYSDGEQEKKLQAQLKEVRRLKAEAAGLHSLLADIRSSGIDEMDEEDLESVNDVINRIVARFSGPIMAVHPHMDSAAYRLLTPFREVISKLVKTYETFMTGYHSNGRWMISLGNKGRRTEEIQLPRFADLNTGSIAYPPTMSQLMYMREKIIQAIAVYESVASSELTEEEQGFLFYGLNAGE